MEIRIAEAGRAATQNSPADYLSVLTREERERIQRLRFEQDRLRSALGACLIHGVFEEEYGKKEYRLTRNRYGKPSFAEELLNEKPVYFNLSHSGELVVLARSDTEVGVDVEKIRAVSADRFRRVLSEEETARIHRADDPQREFFKIWTKKEAWAKAEGSGLSALDRFEKEASRFTFATFEHNGHIISVCAPDWDGAYTVKLLSAFPLAGG